MASIERRGDSFRIVFRFNGQKFSRSLKTRSQKEATASLARLEDNLRRLELGTLPLPEHADLGTFLLSDGQAAQKPTAPNLRTLAALLDEYLESLSHGAVEETTLKCMRIHVRHLKRILGDNRSLPSIRLPDLQTYVNKRAADEGLRGRKVTGTTIKKDLVTLTAARNWGIDRGELQKPLPKKGLKYPKTVEKPPFQTWEEIERRIRRGKLSEEQQADLWDSLFLTLPEIDDVLSFVKETAHHPFLYPLFVFAAHSGARRSEILRCEVGDVDLVANVVTIHEKKRVRGKLTTRQVPLSPLLRAVMRDWLAVHPGGNALICHGPEVGRSKTARGEPLPLTWDEAHDHFKRTLAGSKWKKLRGWHVFRHSFCSNCAAAGIDQRIINGWVGHQTEEMVRRYRHLIPNQQQHAIANVFGNHASESGQMLADAHDDRSSIDIICSAEQPTTPAA
jgi:integrase